MNASRFKTDSVTEGSTVDMQVMAARPLVLSRHELGQFQKTGV